MEVISGAGVGQEMESHFIGGHGPYTGVPDSVPLGDAGIPEACADDAPIEGRARRARPRRTSDAGPGNARGRGTLKGEGQGQNAAPPGVSS